MTFDWKRVLLSKKNHLHYWWVLPFKSPDYWCLFIDLSLLSWIEILKIKMLIEKGKFSSIFFFGEIWESDFSVNNWWIRQFFCIFAKRFAATETIITINVYSTWRWRCNFHNVFWNFRMTSSCVPISLDNT